MDLPQIFNAELLRRDPAALPIRFASRPGIPLWNEVSPASQLLAEAVNPIATDRILVLGSGHGALASHLARAAAQGAVLACDTSALALAMTQETARLNGIAHLSVDAGIDFSANLESSFDLAIMELPKGRKLARRWLLEAARLLKPGAPLYLAGANDEGIRSTIADAAEVFGEANLLDLRRRNRVARAIAPLAPMLPQPDWASLPGIAPGSWYPLEVDWQGRRYGLQSLPGIFSFDRLDPGTAFLLEHAPSPQGLRVLDFGCGYGFIGLWAALQGAAQVDLTDVNLWAVEAARQNLTRHGMSSARVFTGDGLNALGERCYELALANLPFHVGKEVDSGAAVRFIQAIRARLVRGGRLICVTNRFIRHDPLLKQLFQKLNILAEDDGYRVVSAV